VGACHSDRNRRLADTARSTTAILDVIRVRQRREGAPITRFLASARRISLVAVACLGACEACGNGGINVLSGHHPSTGGFT